jgi:hypothetical protein
MTSRMAVAAALAAALVAGFVVVAIVQDVPDIGRSWPGQGFLVLAAVGIIAFACLIDALRAGRAHRSALPRSGAYQAGPQDSDEQRS